jgi:hypothetical protein
MLRVRNPVMMVSEGPAARNSIFAASSTHLRHVARAPILMWIVGGLALCGLLVSTAGSVLSTHKEVHRYLAMPDYIGAVPENMQSAISQSLPIGSSQGDVQRYLSVRGIGHDHGSACAVNPNAVDITCELGIDQYPWELVGETFNLSFTFDSSNRLSAIRIKSTFSSP